MRSSLTDCGLPGIKEIPYGVHMCHFYERREDLAAALVPYFAAGLRNRERCIWITAAPLPAAQARGALRDAGLDVEAALGSGALVIRDYEDWYTDGQTLKGCDVVAQWLTEEERALAAGYRGLRITGNTSFLTPASWAQFMEYEALIDRTFQGRRIVTLCSYRLRDWEATHRHDVACRHGCTLERPDEGWQILLR